MKKNIFVSSTGFASFDNAFGIAESANAVAEKFLQASTV